MDSEKRIKDFREWIDHDIEVAIEKDAKFLAVLGLCIYIEFLGGLWRKNHKKGQGNPNFTEGLNKMGTPYQELNKNFIGDDSIYHKVRCGLAHEYFIKENATVWQNAIPENIDCGIVVDPSEKHITIYPRKLFIDFQKMREEYIGEIKRKPELFDYFTNAWRTKETESASGSSFIQKDWNDSLHEDIYTNQSQKEKKGP